MRPVTWVLLTVVVLVLATSVPGRAAEKWTSLRSEHFVFVGDAPARQIREVAQHLEQFRDVLSRALPPAAVTTSIPTVVIVFQSDRSFTRYKPWFQGRPTKVAGYFQGGTDVNYMAINVEVERLALRIIFHEYSHFLARNMAGELPLWANEGLAGVYETFEARSGGKSAMIGMPHADHLVLLQNNRLMPLADLLAVDHSSTVYNEGDRRGVFYAESWALMHYLMFGNQARGMQLHDYFARLKSGAEPDQAFKVAFGGDVDALERELREYIRKSSFPVLRLDFQERVSGSGAGRGDPMDLVEASAYLGNLLARIGRVDVARAQLKKLVEANPQSSRAASVLGRLELKSGTLNDALPLLERAATLDPKDGTAHSAWGRALFASAQEKTDNDNGGTTELRQQARTVLNRAIELSPGDAATFALLGRLESIIGTNPARASQLLERAATIAPAEDGYRLMLAEELVRQGEHARATRYLAPLAAGGSLPEIREAARDLLGFVAVRVESARVNDGDPADGDPAASPASAAASRESEPGRFRLELRPVGPGERRVLGMFTAVECGTGSIVLTIEAEDQTLRLATDSLAKVQFITYRDTSPGSVGCGAVNPASPVFATFREDDTSASANQVDGQVVAIELLPDGYEPR